MVIAGAPPIHLDHQYETERITLQVELLITMLEGQLAAPSGIAGIRFSVARNTFKSESLKIVFVRLGKLHLARKREGVPS